MNNAKEDTMEFSSDIKDLLDLIIKKLYSSKEIFLRELLSNASDALEKIRYESITDPTKLDSEPRLRIEIVPNIIENTLTILDTGIGMTKNDLIKNLGTIAKSGTKSFYDSIDSKENHIKMVGQFGVGFYSAYLVANKVTVHSKHNDHQQYCWESTANGVYTIKLDTESEKLTRGTKIVLHLKDNMTDYLEDANILELVKKYSDFIQFPIMLMKKKIRHIPNDTKSERTENDGSNQVEKIYYELEKINSQKPIWLQNKNELSNKDYNLLYLNINDHSRNYILHEHFSVEGQVEFTSVLFIPEDDPNFNFFRTKKYELSKNITIYSNNMFVMDGAELLPNYLSFIIGIVDIKNLPLNISRELVQDSNILKIIKKNITKKCVNMFYTIAEDSEKYKCFYEAFSRHIKKGVCEDNENAKKLLKLLRYYTSKSEDHMISLDTYISRMQEGQDNIYYITGENIDTVKNLPFLEKLKSQNYEIVYMIDTVDEFIIPKIDKYCDIKLISVLRDSFEINIHDKLDPCIIKDTDELIIVMKELLQNNVVDIKITKRLTSTPCCITVPIDGFTANVERVVKSIPMKEKYVSKRILEINPQHSLIKILANKVRLNKNDEVVKNIILMLHDLAIITSGYMLTEPEKFTNQVIELLNVKYNIL